MLWVINKKITHSYLEEYYYAFSQDAEQPGHQPFRQESLLYFHLKATISVFLHVDSYDSGQTGWMSSVI